MDFNSDDENVFNQNSVWDLSDSDDEHLNSTFRDLSFERRTRFTATRPQRTTMCGIVYKMDHLAKRALVRVMIDQDDIHQYEGVCIQTDLDKAMNFTGESPAEITRYSFETVKTKKNELVALTKVHHNYLNVVGGAYNHLEGIVGFTKESRLFNWRSVPNQSFLYGDLIKLPEHYKVVLNNETPELVYAEQFVLDPLLTCAALEEYVAKELEKEFTVQVSDLIFDIQKRFNPHRYVVNVPMTAGIKECFRKRGRETWHLGSDLVLSTEMFGGNNIPVIIERTDWEIRGKMYIRLCGRSGYEPVLESLNKNPDKINWPKMNFHLGPKSLDANRNSKTIRKDFSSMFLYGTSLFDAFTGRSVYTDNIAEFDNYEITGEILDDSQKLAVKTALNVKGFTCISAPPGSGKTFLISQIIAAKLCKYPSTRFAVCGATNNAVTNALEAVRSKLPDEKLVRQFSPKAESELEKNAAILEISLRRMIEDEEIIRPLMRHPHFERAAEERDKAKRLVEQKTKNVRDQLRYVAEFKRADAALGVQFVKYYAPSVFGTTGSIMAGVTHERITHLVIDEASQMSQVDALFLYCRLTNLQYITLVGDTRQLGPFTGINKGTLAYEIRFKGELNRLEELNSSAKVQLEYIYRSHPKIMDLLLKPIYGQHLKSGTSATERNLAEEKNLPRALDGTPCLFVHVDGEEKNGKNKREAEVVLDFLDYLILKGVKLEDQIAASVSDSCNVSNHKAQKDNLSQVLKDRGIIGPLNLKYSVNTVDSYQGKESKIVLVLTTKTCETRKPEALRRIFSFISDPHRETVAVSRAQHAVYLFGNWKQLMTMPFWSQFKQGIMQSAAMVNENWIPIGLLAGIWKTDQ